MEEESDDSVSLIFSVIKDTLGAQQVQKNSLETKASTLIAFAGVIFALLMGARETLILLSTASQTLILVSIILFAISVILAIAVSWVKEYRSDPNPEILANDYIQKTKQATQLQIISNWVGTWKTNASLLERNAKFLRGAFAFQFLAFFLLGIALFLSVISK